MEEPWRAHIYMRSICTPLLLLSLMVGTRTVRSEVYLILLDESPVVHYEGSLDGHPATAASYNRKIDTSSFAVQNYAAYLKTTHDDILATTLEAASYKKLYSYHHLVNGFAADLTPEQADLLSEDPRVSSIELDRRVETATTHTPDYLGLPQGAWLQTGGVQNAGEDVVVGIIDTGIDPNHPSFSNNGTKPYGPLPSFRGACEVADEFPAGSCNNKIVGAQHFAQAAIAAGVFNSSEHFASPLDGDGHGTHTASTAAGNNGIPVMVNGLYFGEASGIAPRARIAVYKCLYRYFGGYFADVVAAVDQAAQDGVDVISLSIAPTAPPADEAVYLNIFDIALLGAVRAGVFVTQAVGNAGPMPFSTLSWSPWIVSVAASSNDRNYSNSITLGNGELVLGVGLASETPGSKLYTLVSSIDVKLVDSSSTVHVDECQNSAYFDKSLVEGNILICSYTYDFVFGFSTISKAVDTAMNLSAAGLVLTVSSDVENRKFGPTPLGTVPAILISSPASVQAFYDYYYSSTTKSADGRPSFGAKAKINGGSQAIYTGVTPVVAAFSSRGPDYNEVVGVPADVMKPTILAPGVLIWAAWTPIGIDNADYRGQNFAMISGTSMATPHIAGVAALVKQKHPTWSPAAIASALVGTAYTSDSSGRPLVAQVQSSDGRVLLERATPFDFGGGHVDPTAALDPGLVFDAGFQDYVTFLCRIPSVTPAQVVNSTGVGCETFAAASGYASDLNAPHVTIGTLEGSRVVPRTVLNVARYEETYSVRVDSPADVSAELSAGETFALGPGESHTLYFTFKATITTNQSTFGAVNFIGSRGHRVIIPITVSRKIFASP